MLIADPYSLLPAFALAAFLGITLWPENIAFKSRLRLFIVILCIWMVASLLAMMGYANSEQMLVYIINFIVGFLGLIALMAAYQIKPSRTKDQNPK